MNEAVLNELHAYAVDIRRKLHMYPEVGFDLPKTVALVTEELTNMGIGYTLQYGEGSVVAEIGQGDLCLGLRADMDALPVEEKVDLPFASKVPGVMHACGHDSHTGILLAVAKYLKEHEDQLPCRVRFLFQPSEEGAISGAKMMMENGALEGLDEVLCTHCEPTMGVGLIGICPGDYMAACIPGTIRFHGRTAHAARQDTGINAVSMGVDAYVQLKEMIEKEAAGYKYIWCNGKLAGGHVHNVVPDECELAISFRFYDMEFAARVTAEVKRICTQIAESYGGTADIEWNMSTGPVHNDAAVCDRICALPGISEKIRPMPQRMSSEDFGWFLSKVPGAIFRFGCRNEAKGWTQPAHCNDFCLDEDGMRDAIEVFIAYVINR